MNKIKKFLIFIVIIFFSSIFTAHAADLSLVAPKSINIGQKFSVDLQVHTDGISINSVDIGVSYPKNLVKFTGYQEDGSVVKLWLKHPEDKSGVIQLSGIIPGGVDGSYSIDSATPGPLSIVKLLFTALNPGQGSFNIDHSTILVNDGYGTEFPHDNKNTLININSNSQSSTIPDKNNNDNVPPEPFNIDFIDSGYFSKTPPMIIFNTTDLDSGVEKYIMNDGSGTWVDVTSPWPIKKSFFSRDIMIRAIDYSGNIRESSVTIPGILPINLVIVIIIIVLIFIYSRFMRYKNKRKK